MILTFDLLCAHCVQQVPAWPFVTLSFFLGAFSLLPYFAFWQPCPSKRIYQSKDKIGSFLESKLSAGLLLGFLGKLFLNEGVNERKDHLGLGD